MSITVPQDYSALVFADQGLGIDLSRARPARRKVNAPALKPDQGPKLSASELRYMQVEHVITRMRAANGRPAVFLWPEAA